MSRSTAISTLAAYDGRPEEAFAGPLGASETFSPDRRTRQ